MKSIVVAAVLCSSIALALSQGTSDDKTIDQYKISEKTGIGAGDKTIGEHQAGETLLHNEKINKDWSCCGWRTYAEIHFRDNNYRITLIKITSNHETVDRAATYDIYGGVGQKEVSIDFESQPYRGVYYTVKVYGVYVN